MRGYFGIGSEGISKPMNLGAVLRTAHAFNASFAFSVNAHHRAREVNLADTAKSASHMPLYEWDTLEDIRLPKGCVMVGVELTDDAIDLPSFRHPQKAAYILGPEKGSLTPEAQALCTHIIKIPMRFCVNLSVAAALVMYDRTLSMGGFRPRPVAAGGPTEPLPPKKEWQSVRFRH
ncbi:RNA methyltransferase [Hyphococcus sp. DH-69]|uniref:RNA methyltransferase n=1 Tax=Hyphococcus formosus TaxID=3143534 RepID=UPI00398A9123